jgi:hypothetical protein
MIPSLGEVLTGIEVDRLSLPNVKSDLSLQRVQALVESLFNDHSVEETGE